MEKKKLSEVLKEKIAKLEQQMEQLKAEKPNSTTTLTKKEHTHSSKVLFDCPECQKEYNKSIIDNLKPQILAEQREIHKKMHSPQLCEECGEIYEGEERENCPTCKGRSED